MDGFGRKWMKWMDCKRNRAHSQNTNGPFIQIMSKRDLKRSLNLSSSSDSIAHRHPTVYVRTRY